ncbi:protein RAE1 [Artemisia annua]|uniref:Protein RAE1 n=1 Tax=Artemisia annua TaxID=35608 RepID=A0A2U1QGS0_ARTAN|nr:protein RAE1 [Artemisia annua]
MAVSFWKRCAQQWTTANGRQIIHSTSVNKNFYREQIVADFVGVETLEGSVSVSKQQLATGEIEQWIDYSSFVIDTDLTGLDVAKTRIWQLVKHVTSSFLRIFHLFVWSSGVYASGVWFKGFGIESVFVKKQDGLRSITGIAIGMLQNGRRTFDQLGIAYNLRTRTAAVKRVAVLCDERPRVCEKDEPKIVNVNVGPATSTAVHTQQLPDHCYPLTVRHPLMVVATADRNLIAYNLQNLRTGQYSATDANEGGHVLAPQENVRMVYEVVRLLESSYWISDLNSLLKARLLLLVMSI